MSESGNWMSNEEAYQEVIDTIMDYAISIDGGITIGREDLDILHQKLQVENVTRGLNGTMRYDA